MLNAQQTAQHTAVLKKGCAQVKWTLKDVNILTIAFHIILPLGVTMTAPSVALPLNILAHHRRRMAMVAIIQIHAL